MTMKKLHIIIFILFMGLTFLSSCSETILDVAPQGQLTGDVDTTLPIDSKSAEGELIAAYQPVRWVYPWGMSFYVATNVAADDIVSGGAAANDRPEYEACDKFTIDQTNAGTDQLWIRFYTGIARCNKFIFDYKAKTTNDSLVRFVSEAKFLRAYYYFALIRLYGNIPMPLLPTDGAISQVKPEEVYTQIETDLSEAIASGKLPQKADLTIDEKILSRVTKNVAKALLGKVYVFEKKWDEAYTQLNAVYISGEYALNPDFKALWSSTSELKDENNPETMFEAYFTDAIAWDWGVGKHPEGNLDMQLMGVRNLTGINGLQPGWGFCKPNDKMITAFEADDSIRYNATIISADWLDEQGATYDEPYNATGYWNGKYRQDENAAQPNVYAQNEMIMRFAEVILLLAEVEYRRGNEAAALGYINEIRARVKLAAKNSSGAALWNDIVKEKQVELALECSRYFDLIRWDMTSELEGFKASTKGLWPIPINALLTDPLLKQNEGY